MRRTLFHTSVLLLALLSLAGCLGFMEKPRPQFNEHDRAAQVLRDGERADLTKAHVTDAQGLTHFADDADREYSDLERRWAQEFIDAGQTLDSAQDAAALTELAFSKARAAVRGASSEQIAAWTKGVRGGATGALSVHTGWAPADAFVQTFGTSTASQVEGELTRALEGAGEALVSGGDVSAALAGDDLSGRGKAGLIRAALDSGIAAGGTSDLYFLSHLESEYSVDKDGIGELSLLGVQPIYESDNLRHTMLMQGSWINKQERDTINAGVIYRYMTPDERYLYGVNMFYDHQFPYDHQRLGIGAEVKTALYGANLNYYHALSDWRARSDFYDERALSGADFILSGKMPGLPELELFAKGYLWDQDKTAVLTPDGDNIWGQEYKAEFTPVPAITLTSALRDDTDLEETDFRFGLRLNYVPGKSVKEMFEPAAPLDLTSVAYRRYEKVERENEIRVQERQNLARTAIVTFTNGANTLDTPKDGISTLTNGQGVAYGSTITVANTAGAAATLTFGNGAILDIGQNSEVIINADNITLVSGIVQFLSGSGGITNLNAPGQSVQLLGTDVDLRVAGGVTTLRVRDGAADFSDDTGTTRVNATQVAQSVDADAAAPVIITAGANFDAHVNDAHQKLNLTGSALDINKAAPYSPVDTTISGTLQQGQALTFSVPFTKAVTSAGGPITLDILVGGTARSATLASGDGSQTLVFTYTLIAADGGASGVSAERIALNGGSLKDASGKNAVLQVGGSLGASVVGVNDAPSFTIGANQTATIGEGTVTVAGFINPASFLPGGGADEAGQTIADFIVSEAADASNVVSSVDIANNGDLTFTVHPNNTGVATINVQVQDDGGTANGGTDTSAVQTFTITVGSLVSNFGTPAAAYSLRDLAGGDPNVVRVRRSSDNAEADFTSTQITDGAMASWVNTEKDLIPTTGTTSAFGGTGSLSNATVTSADVNAGASGLDIANLSDTFPVTQGLTYEVTMTVTGNLEGSPNLRLAIGPLVSNVESLLLGTNTYTFVATADAANASARIFNIDSTSGCSISFDDIKQVTSNGFVRTWYDQAGTNHATQTVTANQPQIVSNGSVILENGLPALFFNGSIGEKVLYAPSIGATTALTVFGVVNTEGAGLSPVIGELDFFNDGWEILYTSPTSLRLATNLEDNNLTVTANRSLFTGLFNASGSETSVNAGAPNALSFSETLSTNELVLVGGRGNAGNPSGWFKGDMQEIIIYNSDQTTSRAAIEADINGYYSIY